MSLPVKLRIVLDAVAVVFFAWMAFISLEWQMTARIMPLTVAGLAVVFGLINLVGDVLRWRRMGYAFVAADRGATANIAASRDEASEREAAAIRLGLRYFGWIAAYGLLMYAVGAIVGSALFLAAFLKIEGHYSWKLSVAAIVGVILGLLAAESLLDMRLPRNLLGL